MRVPGAPASRSASSCLSQPGLIFYRLCRKRNGADLLRSCRGAQRDPGLMQSPGAGTPPVRPRICLAFGPWILKLRRVNIPEHRKAIDKLDAQIVKLLNERTKHVLGIGDAKLKAGEEIYVPHRERAVLDRICKLNDGPITNDGLRAIYREVMSSALSLEKTMTIAYFGPEATFTHQAALRKFGASLNYSAQRTIADVFTEVARQRADYGVVPVENSTEGVVTHTLDMFADSELKVVAQIVMRVQQCLMSKSAKKDIQKLFVHPQSLAQCRGWIQNHLPHVEIIESSSNARSAELAAKTKNSAALGGTLAAQRYGLDVLEADIQDNATNTTRFLVLGRQCSPPTPSACSGATQSSSCSTGSGGRCRATCAARRPGAEC